MKFFGSIICLLAFVFSYHIGHAQPPLAADQQEPSRTPQDADVIFQLIESIRFADGTIVESIAKDEIDALRDLPVRLGENVGIDGVTLTKIRDKVHVHTCREYDAALQRGYYPMSTFDITMSHFFKFPCGLLNALEKANLPEDRFISGAKVSIVNVELLPFEMFPGSLAEGSSWDERDLETTYQDKIDNQELAVTEKSQNVLDIEGFIMTQRLREIVRADFNSDGIEDVLVFEAHSVKQGTHRYAGIIVLTRKSMNGKFEVLQPPDSQQSSGHPYWF